MLIFCNNNVSLIYYINKEEIFEFKKILYYEFYLEEEAVVEVKQEKLKSVGKGGMGGGSSGMVIPSKLSNFNLTSISKSIFVSLTASLEVMGRRNMEFKASVQ